MDVELKETFRAKATMEVYRFRFEEYGGWAHFKICEETGEFSISSDWGHYTQLWHPDNYAGTLKAFLASCHSDYVVSKLAYNEHLSFREQFDEKRTRNNIKDDIIQRRREKILNYGQAHECWTLLDEWGMDPPEVFWNEMPSELWKYLYDDSDCDGIIATRVSPSYKFLVDTLVPFFQDILRKELKTNEVPSATVA